MSGRYLPLSVSLCHGFVMLHFFEVKRRQREASRIKRSAFLPSAHPLIAERGFMHNMHCFIFVPTAHWAAFRRPRRQPGCTATPARPGKAPTGPKKSRSGGVSARCHAKVPPKDRIFGRGRDSRHGVGALTCGSPEPAARSIRPTDENPILWRDFCSGAGRSRRIPWRFRAGGPANRSQKCRVRPNGRTRHDGERFC